jgi:hypothetical protein
MGERPVAQAVVGAEAEDAAGQCLIRDVDRLRVVVGVHDDEAAAGLCDVQVEGMTLVVRDPAAVDNVMGLRTWAGSGHAHGLLPAEDAARWPAVLDEAITAGRFLYAVTFFLTSGVKAGESGAA